MACRSRADRHEGGDGFSLVELLVTMTMFTIILAIFGSALTLMSKDVRHQLGQSDGLDATRRVLAQLDKQVRYANALNTPVTTGSAPSLTYWVEWRTGIQGQQQTCTQWRLLPTGQMQYRTWQPSTSGGATTGLSVWSTRATGISPPAGGVPFALPPPAVLATQSRQQLVVSFLASYGAPRVTTPSQVTLTSQNTYSSSPLLTPVCQEVART